MFIQFLIPHTKLYRISSIRLIVTRIDEILSSVKSAILFEIKQI